MLLSKSLLFVCIGGLTGQTFFQTSQRNEGSFTRNNYGSASLGEQVYKVTPVKPAYQPPTTGYHQPAHQPPPSNLYQKPVQPAYQPQPPQPSYQKTPYQQPAYQQPTYQQPTYQQPTYQQQTYQQPAYSQPSYPQPHDASPTYGEKCTVDYEDKYTEVCTPTLESSCTHEQVPNGLRITEEYDCYPVTRTICTEFEDIDLTEVCAVSYTLEQVTATARLVDVKWEKICQEEVFCENPHSSGAYHAAAYCKEQIKSVCTLSPVMYPVEKTVVMKLPQPFDTCITKEIILPRLKCQQVTEKRCATTPKTLPSEPVDIDKCTVSLGQPYCQDSTLKLPRQVCLESLKKTVLVYEEETNSSYAARF